MSTPTGREALLRATITVVARGGLPELTYRSVASEAGVSHGLVRHHFGTRDALLSEALEFAVNESLSESNMLAPLSDASTFGEGIDDLAVRDATLQAFQYELLLASRSRPEFQPLVQRYYSAYRDAAAARLSDLGVTDQSVVDMIWFCLDGLVFKGLINPDADEGNRVMARIRKLIIDEAPARG
ncbi:TetR family transcriptional regulator [Salinibacterium sp. G-O1]|uniref:TetR/AcrR family transcriptional regulator n=1 Tax=Salinibacterium sp. G-O1 TaxID=3046208 RepID=UPI0024B95887|nr:TetR/AcrR family transcriptional regulator [Salinibacterium sp. G-O1]MDJ0336268.1 TetR family transcriptional regulator [Salinibacterium sp. G-O1]